MKNCPSCHRDFTDDLEFCPSDGVHLIPVSGEVDPQLKLAFAGRFRIIRQLGAGGMGRVFLAEQVGVGNRLVALKVLSRNPLDDSDFLERFHNEAASAGRIDNPNVVTIYESGQVSDSTPYIAMQYLEGETLRQSLKQRGALPVAECNEIIQQIARGLHAAHRLGIIHRDLKPDNIFLTIRDEDKLVVKVVDFGIAKLRESGTHTITGTVLGTPAYMSYEQACGMRSDELDARSDIYSLGVVVYEMLTGRLPFQSDTPVGYLKKHLQEAPPPFRSVKPDFPALPEVERVVITALTKDREHRFKSVLEFASDFSRAAAIPPLPVELQPTVQVVDPAKGKEKGTPEIELPKKLPPLPRVEPRPEVPSAQQLPTVQKGKLSRRRLGVLIAAGLVAIVATLAWRYWIRPYNTEQETSMLLEQMNIRPDPVRAHILVRTHAGAQVFLDGEDEGSADSAGVLVVGSVFPGKHALRVSLEGQTGYEDSFTIGAGQTINIDAPLADVSGPVVPVPAAKTTVVIETSPGAQVWFDDRLVGLADYQGRMTIQNSRPGSHSMGVSQTGMKVYSSHVTVRANQANVFAADLTPDQPTAPAAGKPLTEREIVTLLDGGIPSKRIRELVTERGIDFKITPQVESDLRGAGATDDLIAKLRNYIRW